MTDIRKERYLRNQIFQATKGILALAIAALSQSAPSGFLCSVLDIAMIFSFVFIIMFIGECITRIFEYMKEMKYASMLYEDKYSLFSTVFFFNKKTVAFCTANAFFLFLSMLRGLDSLDIKLVPLGCIILAAVSFYELIEFRESDLRTIMNLSMVNGLDYGSGMAYSFYYGYLRLILPRTGDENKGIIEKINDFASINYYFPLKKLIILIPSSGYIETSFDHEYDDYKIEPAQSLETKIIDRAGVVARVYKNSVYKILSTRNPERRPTYVAVEGATPLKTLLEVIQYGSSSSGAYRKYKSELIYNFYRNLQFILETEPEVRNTCELIYYNDTDERGRPGNVNIARLIMERIHERCQ